MAEPKPVVALTGLEGRDNPYPGVAIARALRAARQDRVRIIGFAYDPTLTGNFRSDLFDAVYLTPLPGAPAATLKKRIFEIHDQDPIDVFLPALDSELAIFSMHREEFTKRGIQMSVPSPEAIKARYKQRLPGFAEKHGIFTPETEVVTSPDNFWDQEAWSFPCYLKGPLADAIKVENLAEAVAGFHRLVSRWGYPVLAQKTVNGEEFDICALAQSGRSLASICIKKTVLNDAGKAIGAEVVDTPGALAAAEKVISALDWDGPLEVELVRESSSGRYFLLEVNARFPAWIGASPALGLNLPDLALSLALGEDRATPAAARVGARFLRTSKTTISRVEDLGRLLSAGAMQLSSMDL